MPRSCRTRRTGSNRAGKRAKPPLRSASLEAGAGVGVAGENVCFSNRPFGVKRFQTIHPCNVRCRSRARASLRNRHQGPSIMGFEDEVEQSYGRPSLNGRSKQTYELTSSIVPRGTSFHCWVDLGFSPIALILCAAHAATVSLVQRNSVPSTCQSAFKFGSDSLLMKFECRLALVSQGNQHDA